MDSVSDNVCACWKISNFAIGICSEGFIERLGTISMSVPNAAKISDAGEETGWDMLILRSISGKVSSSSVQKS